MTLDFKRQFITDAFGNPIRPMMPLEDYALVENIILGPITSFSRLDDQFSQIIRGLLKG